MGNAPERIFAWVYEAGARRHHVWRGKVGPGGEGQTEYVRADLAPAPSWQPISTAPKDGTVIDLWVTEKLADKGGLRFCDMVWSEKNRKWVDCQMSLSRSVQDRATTHWMHRPDPPEAS